MEGLPAYGGPARLWRACLPMEGLPVYEGPARPRGDLLFAFRSGGLQFTLLALSQSEGSLEGPRRKASKINGL